MIDLKQLANSLSNEKIIELVTNLGADRYEEKNDCIIFPTICHNESPEDASMKLYYYKKNKKFHCYTDCGDNFNIFELFKRRYDLLHIDYDFYKDIVLKIADGQSYTPISNNFGQYYEKINYGHKQDINVKIPIIPKTLLNVFQIYLTPEWKAEGIELEQIKRFNILYSINQNKIIIPHYDINDNLIGIRGRALNEEDIAIGKYMPVSIEGKIYAHPLGYNLYGLNLNKNNIKRKKIAIVFEGEKSVILYDKYYGKDNNISVAVCGNSISRYQVELLLSAGAEKIIIAFDNPTDCKNEQDQIKQYEKMKKVCLKYNSIIDIGFIIDRKRLLQNKDSPIDRGKKVFEEMMKYVQWI